MEPLAQSLRRAALYRLAAGALSYPAPALLASVRDQTDRCLAASREGGALAAALAAFRRVQDETPADALAEEYVFLFDRQVPCPPYETAYGDGRRMAGKAAELADVAGFYTAFHLRPSTLHPDMEDHVAAELEFMSILALKEAVARADGLDRALEVTRGAERLFLRDHLGRWAGAFARRLRETTSLPYYRAAADLLGSLVDAEVRALGAKPAPVTGLVGADPLQAESLACPFGGACGPEGAEPDEAPPARDRAAPGRVEPEGAS